MLLRISDSRSRANYTRTFYSSKSPTTSHVSIFAYIAYDSFAVAGGAGLYVPTISPWHSHLWSLCHRDRNNPSNCCSLMSVEISNLMCRDLMEIAIALSTVVVVQFDHQPAINFNYSILVPFNLRVGVLYLLWVKSCTAGACFSPRALF